MVQLVAPILAIWRTLGASQGYRKPRISSQPEFNLETQYAFKEGGEKLSLMPITHFLDCASCTPTLIQLEKHLDAFAQTPAIFFDDKSPGSSPYFWFVGIVMRSLLALEVFYIMPEKKIHIATGAAQTCGRKFDHETSMYADWGSARRLTKLSMRMYDRANT